MTCKDEEVHTCNPISTPKEVKAGESWVQGHPWLVRRKPASTTWDLHLHTHAHAFHGNEILIKCVSFSKLMGEVKELSFVCKGEGCSETAERLWEKGRSSCRATIVLGARMSQHSLILRGQSCDETLEVGKKMLAAGIPTDGTWRSPDAGSTRCSPNADSTWLHQHNFKFIYSLNWVLSESPPWLGT